MGTHCLVCSVPFTTGVGYGRIVAFLGGIVNDSKEWGVEKELVSRQNLIKEVCYNSSKRKLMHKKGW